MSGGTLDSIYLQGTRLIEDFQQHILPRYERSLENSEIESIADSKLLELEQLCERMEIAVNKEPPARRPQSKIKLDQLRYDYKHLCSAVRGLKARKLQKE